MIKHWGVVKKQEERNDPEKDDLCVVTVCHVTLSASKRIEIIQFDRSSIIVFSPSLTSDAHSWAHIQE